VLKKTKKLTAELQEMDNVKSTKNLNTNLNFNIKDLDQILLEKIINENIDSIYNSPNARKGRTREQIRSKVSQGIPCEVYMIQFHNCIENTELYGDVITQKNIKVECKSSLYKWDDYKKNKMIDSIKGYSPSDICMFWQKIGDNYIYQGAERI